MPGSPSRLRLALGSIITRLAAYYLAIFALGWSTWNLLPPGPRDFLARNLGPVLGGAQFTGDLTAPLTPATPSAVGGSHEMAILALLVGGMAIALSLPLAWVYMHTRQKKGYQQSVVHTIVLLPAVVAAVSLLVRNNVGLAFSLAGIVAAVRFRTTLEDSRDAVFIFAVSALGLACGVHLEFAAALSFLFAVIALGLWYSDFGRTPPALEGARAEQRLQRAMAIANRTSQFVARVDNEVLKDLSPAQLEALAGRLRKRRDEAAPAEAPKWDANLIVVAPDVGGRETVERILQQRAKRFEFARAEFMNGTTRLTFSVRIRRGVTPREFADLVRQDSDGVIQEIIVEDRS